MKTLGIIGAGNMGGSICKAVALSNDFNSDNIYVYDKYLKNEIRDLGVKCESFEEAVKKSDCIILAVKPNVILSVIEDVKKVCDISGKVFVSIAAGVKLKTLTDALSSQKVIRVMPNICLSAGEGMCVMCTAENVKDNELSFAKEVFEL